MNTFMELSDDSESSSTFQKNAFVSSSQASQNSHRKNENVGLVNYIYQVIFAKWKIKTLYSK